MASSTPKNTGRKLRVDEKEDAQVLFVPGNEDRFVLTCAETIRAVQAGMSVELLANEVGDLIKHVLGSLGKHAGRIENLCRRVYELDAVA